MTQPLLESPQPAALQLLREQFSEAALERICGPDRPPNGSWQESLLGPLSEFLSRPGKEFRSRLVEVSFRVAGGQGQIPPMLPYLVELLHAGSLIVDDIQDGSASRRGAPALHRKHGVPASLNAGNWMYFLAFDLVQRLDVGPHIELSLYRWMSQSVFACHYGQALDLTASLPTIPQGEVESVTRATTRLKTGALMELAAASGAVAAGGKKSTVLALTRFAGELGRALQMLDDLGGLTDDSRRHKGHEDLLNGCPTWPWAWLSTKLSSARFLELQELSGEVMSGGQHPELLAQELRRHLGKEPRALVSRELKGAFAALREEVGNHPVLHQLSAEVSRMEQSYGR